MSIWGQIVSEIVAQLYSENSIQTLLIFLGVDPKLRLVELELCAVIMPGALLGADEENSKTY